MRRHADVPFWLSVGDVADGEGRYEALPAPLYWIKGNNENFDAIAARDLPAGLHYVANARLQTIDGLRVAGLGGTFAPTWYDTAAADLPFPGRPAGEAGAARGGAGRRVVRDDKRRHFVREEVEACRALRDVDVFLTHEAARPYRVGLVDAGKTPVNDVLAAMQPRLHLFGHHHRFSEQRRQGVRSVGLDVVSRSYLLIDRKTLDYELIT
jgi:Icc-related predicted phosphoesterase